MRRKLLLLAGLCVCTILPISVSSADCNASYQCPNGPTIYCTLVGSGTCSSGVNYVRCGTQTTFCPCQSWQTACTVGWQCISYCEENYPGQSWFPLCFQGCCDCALGN